jgi:hypothetical protein
MISWQKQISTIIIITCGLAILLVAIHWDQIAVPSNWTRDGGFGPPEARTVGSAMRVPSPTSSRFEQGFEDAKEDARPCAQRFLGAPQGQCMA